MGWEVVLTLTVGGHKGGGSHRRPNIHKQKAEYGRAVYCYATASVPLRGVTQREGARVTLVWWDQTGIDWEKAKVRDTETESASDLGTDM